MKTKTKILFVCIGNSCRSQMSEAWAKRLGGNAVEVWSAGSRPAGQVNPSAIAVLNEKGVSAEGQFSKGLNELPQQKWDYLITMGCGDACPTLPAIHRLDWDLDDPVGQPINEFRRVRDEIERRLKDLLGRIKD